MEILEADVTGRYRDINKSSEYLSCSHGFYSSHHAMPSHGNPGRLDRYHQEKRAYLVQMNETAQVDFTDTEVIGTQSLGGCFVVAIGGCQIGILAHIDPKWDMVVEKMRQVEHLYHLYRDCMVNPPAKAWIAVGKTQYGVLEDRMDYILTSLKNLGVDPKVNIYNAEDRTNRPGQGSAYMKGHDRARTVPNFFFEDKEVA